MFLFFLPSQMLTITFKVKEEKEIEDDSSGNINQKKKM